MKTKAKIALYIIAVVVLSVLTIFEISLTMKTIETKSLAYTKEGNISYKTYLKKNNYNLDTYLDENMAIIANLIDYLKVDYKYVYTLNEKIDYELYYNVKANLIVYDSDNNTKPIYTEDFVLIEDKTEKGSSQVIKAELFNEIIDYNKYNRIVQNLKQEISPEANLVVKFNAGFKGFSKTLNKDIEDNYTNSITIPLYKKIISILEPQKTNEKDTITYTGKINVKCLALLVATIVLLVIFISLLIVNIVKTNAKKSKFESKVKKILREFDRAITEANGKLVYDKKDNKIKISDFMELLDVHDNLNAPIIFYKEGNDKVTFVVRNGNDIYYTEIKRSDFD